MYSDFFPYNVLTACIKFKEILNNNNRTAEIIVSSVFMKIFNWVSSKILYLMVTAKIKLSKLKKVLRLGIKFSPRRNTS